MAVLLGLVVDNGEAGVENVRLTAGMRSRKAQPWPPLDSQYTDDERTAFPVVDALPVTANGLLELEGIISGSYFDDYYNRIHIDPNPILLGNIVGGVSRTLDLWNAFLVPRTITSFTPPSDEGVSVITPGGTPLVLAAFQFIKYEIDVTTAGAAILEDTFQWTISGIEYVVPIEGQRVVLWPFPPSWDQRVDETLEWLTAIERSYDGTEQRAALREEPRRVFEYAVKVKRTDAQHFDNLVYGWMGNPFGMPIWTERSRLTTNAALGATVIDCDTTNRSFVVGGALAFYKDRILIEAAEIAAITPSTITLSRPTVNAWPVSTNVFPVMVSMLEAATNARRHTDAVIESAIRFTGVPENTDPRIPASAAPATYLSLELYTERTNWGEALTFEYDGDYEQIDNRVGTFYRRPRAANPTVRKSHAWTLRNATQITDFRKFLGRRRGQAKPVWMPTDTTDFTLVETVAAASTTLIVEGNVFDLYGVHKPERKHIVITLKSGASYHREIIEATAAAGNTTGIQINASLGITLNPSDVRRISFLGLWRMASDNVTISYQTDSVATVTATMKLERP